MHNLKIFENAEFGKIRTVNVNNVPYFVGKDVASALGYKDTSDALKRHVDAEDKMGRQIADSLGRIQNTQVINESGLYSLVLSSKLESAKRFKRWVTSEVLPAIRQTGGYQKPMTAMELLELQMKAIKEVDDKVDMVQQDLLSFKQDLPLLGVEETQITSAVRKKGVECLGGKNSNAYKDNSLRGKVYRDIYKQIYREFGVDTYKAIKRRQTNTVMGIIASYHLPLTLQEQVSDCNAQMSF